MCGSTGYVNLKKKIDNSLFAKMNNIIKHRGPDDEGYVLINENKTTNASGYDTVDILKEKYKNINEMTNGYNIILGHRRLSILDLSEKGHQPMQDESGNIQIVFNGEIYNYIEIRDELKEKGYIFNTNCDTEVIVNAYKEWGTNCVNRFNGMWAFALYDKKQSKIFCSRDRFGIKPFYYYLDEEKIIFASEIKQIIEDKTIKRIANDKVIFNYLFYGKDDYNAETFFKSIYSLLPSHNLEIKLDFNNNSFETKIYRYYDLEKKKIQNSEQINIKELNDELERSIRYRLRSDIPVGSCLSGGLDSSSIVTKACKELEKKQKNKIFETFTSCYDENPEIDERFYSQKVVQRAGCKENLVFPNKENLKEDIEKVIWHQDTPFPTLSIYAQWCVMREANKKGIKVLLDGQGGDETLLGYERYVVFLLKDNLKKLKLKCFYKNYKLYKSSYHLTFSRMMQYLLYFSNNHFLQYLTRYIKSKKMNCLNKEFFKTHKKNKDYLKNMNFKNWFELQETEICHSNLIPLLRYEDRNSMAFSIETRVPFLDYQLIEKEMQIPLEHKIKNGYTKNILREIMKDEMDEEVVFRKNKLGFAAPQKNWINELDESYIYEFINNMKTKKYFNEKTIKEIFEKKINDEMRWKFLSLEIWIKVYDVKIE